MDAAPASDSLFTKTAGRPLLSAGFLGLLATQFLTATNDNIFRWLVIGNWLVDSTGAKGLDRWWLSGVVLIGVAAAGLLTSLPINHLPPGNSDRTFPWDAPQQTRRDLSLLASNLPLFRVALGIAFFYAVGTLAQLNIDQLAAEGGATNESAKSPLLLALIAGVCVGSLLAGFWSREHVELGI